MCSITDNMTAVAVTFLMTTITGTLLSNTQQSFSTVLNAVLAELPIYSLSLLIVGFYKLSHITVHFHPLCYGTNSNRIDAWGYAAI